MVQRLVLFLKGFCMGIADVIPGVSGGTMALVLGIYKRLVDAISGIGIAFFRAVFRGSFWKRFFTILVKPGEDTGEGIDEHAGSAAFLFALVLGIAAALLTGVKLIPILLEQHPEPTHGFFFGLVLASVLVPFRMMKRRSWREAVAFCIALVATFFIVGQKVNSTSNAHGYLTLSSKTGKEIGLPASDIKFSTHRHEGEKRVKREILFVPASSKGEVLIPPAPESLRLKVVAEMAGDEANLPAETLKDIYNTKTDQFVRNALITVKQPEAVSGGSNPALWYIFLCGAIAICAMILPGISGSFILLLLGQYFYILFTVHEIVYGRDLGKISVLGVFMAGILVGIAAFSRVLKWLLARFPSLVMAVLIGLMLGSLRKLWPFYDTTVAGTENRLPEVFDHTVMMTAGTFLLGLAVVLVLNWVGQRQED